MKNFLIIIFITLTLSLVGCSNKDKESNVSMKDIQSFIDKKDLLTIQPVTHTPAKTHWMFKNIKDYIDDGFVIQANINVKLQDVVIVKTNHIDKVKEAINAYKTTALQVFNDGYSSEENALSVKNAILNTSGDYVYFIAAPNASQIESKILQILKK